MASTCTRGTASRSFMAPNRVARSATLASCERPVKLSLLVASSSGQLAGFGSGNTRPSAYLAH